VSGDPRTGRTVRELAHETASPPPGARRAELAISHLLRGGVSASLVLLVVGTIVSLVHHPSYLHSAAAYERLTSGSVGQPQSVIAILRGLAELKGRAIVMLGILVLVATPVLRVALSIVLFASHRDRRFVVITSVVLSLLLLSFALGKAGG
jgi:uncharacterized membrane protein